MTTPARARMADGRDASHATFVRPDLGSFCRLDELGLQLVGQRIEPGVPALLVYPLGLLMLAVQLFSYAPQFVTDWYASSLVLKTVVSGQGARLLFLPFIIVLAVSMSVAWLAYKLDKERAFGARRWLSRLTRTLSARQLFYFPIAVLAGAEILLILALKADNQSILLWPVNALLGVGGGILIYSIFSEPISNR